MNDAPTFEYRHGIATVSDGDAQLRITRFRAEHRDDSVRAELIATCAGRGLARAAWNLTSPRDTKALVEHLVRQADHVRWAQLLQFSAWQAIDAFRAGAPLERTGRRAPTDDRVLLAPLLWRGQPTILYGPGGVGKSLLAAGIAVAVQTGQQLVPGLEPRARGPALILDWETDCDTWNSALQAVCAGVGLEPVEVLYQRMYRPLADAEEEIAATVAEHQVAVIVVDSTEAALTPGDAFNMSAQALFNALRGLETAALVIDHVSGDNLSRDAAAKPIGGIAKVNRARGVWELRAEQEPEDGRIELVLMDRKRNGRVRQPSIGLTARLEQVDQDGVAGCIRWEHSEIRAEELERAALSKHQRMRRLLAEGAMTVADVAAELGMTNGAVRKYVSRYRDIARLEDGRIGLLANSDGGARHATPLNNPQLSRGPYDPPRDSETRHGETSVAPDDEIPPKGVL